MGRLGLPLLFHQAQIAKNAALDEACPVPKPGLLLLQPKPGAVHPILGPSPGQLAPPLHRLQEHGPTSHSLLHLTIPKTNRERHLQQPQSLRQTY